jgi:glycosyltransferase involved in cell wall biosynthesis
MTVHNHNLTCPTWYHLYKGRVCEDCVGGHEYQCVLKNCRNNILESTAYALRSGVARRFRLFHDNVSLFIALTPFAKAKLILAGFRENQIVIVPNPASVNETAANSSEGKYVAFAGRLSPEKGLDTILAAAAQMPDVPFKVAGDGPILWELKARAPRNVEFLGKLGSDELPKFYEGARLLVVPSVWFEQFPMVVLEAMARGLPVIASRIGGLPGIIEEGVSGSLFEPGNSVALMHEVRRLWEDPLLCSRMGSAGRQKALREYTEEAYFQNLMAVYLKAIQRSQLGPMITPLVHINNAESSIRT